MHRPMPKDEFDKLPEPEQLAYIAYLGRRIWLRGLSFYLILASLGICIGSLLGEIFFHKTAPTILLTIIFPSIYVPGVLIGLFTGRLARLKWIPEAD